VVGDAFHYFNRHKVPVHNPFKKGYFVAMQNAWFVWDEPILEQVKASLSASGMPDAEIEAKMYYNVAYFRARVPRVVPPPSKLYFRVRAVYEVYGPKEDESGKPLFITRRGSKRTTCSRRSSLGSHPIRLTSTSTSSGSTPAASRAPTRTATPSTTAAAAPTTRRPTTRAW